MLFGTVHCDEASSGPQKGSLELSAKVRRCAGGAGG